MRRPLPAPQPGLVISYAYLWHREYRAGREEGIKDRPCVIVLSVRNMVDGSQMVRVAPVTHSPQDDAAAALELPRAVKEHLGLDADRSWIILDEVNEFTWPGFDLRPTSRAPDSIVYGFLPPRLFESLIGRLRAAWAKGQGKATPRD